MIKEYFWMAFVGVLFNATLILMDIAGFLPLNIFSFISMFLVIFILSLYRPIWIFWIFIISLPLESVIVSSNQISISFRPFQMIGVMLFLATLILLITKAKNRNLPKMFKFEKAKFFKKGSHLNVFDGLILLLVVCSFVSATNSLNLGVTLKLNLVLASFGMIYFLARFYLQESQRKLEALWFFIATSLPVLAFGVYQAIAFKLNWIDFQVFAERSNGTFAEPDWFGIYLVFLGALIYWAKLYLFRTDNNTMIANYEIRRVGQWFLNFYLFLIFLVLLLTVARSGWLGFLVVTISYFGLLIWQKNIFNLKQFKIKEFLKESFVIGVVYLFSFFVVIGFGLSNFDLFDRAESSLSGLEEITISCQQDSKVPEKIEGVGVLENFNCRHIRLDEIESEKNLGLEVKKVYRLDPNVEIRKNIYKITWQEIKSHFWIGQGLGSSSEVLGKDSFGHGLNASNIFLEVWFSWGVIGLAIFSVLFLMPILMAVVALLKKSKTEAGVGLLIVLTGLALLVPNLFNAGIFLSILYVWLAVANS